MRIFLDANILFSAAKHDGAIRRLLELVASKGHTTHADAFVVEEARRNIAQKDPARSSSLEGILATVAVTATSTMPLGEAIVLAAKDRPVLRAAIAARCDALVTGDRTHFGVYYGSSIRGVEIISPASLAARLMAGDPGV